MYQIGQSGKTECFASVSLKGLTRELLTKHNYLHLVLTLCIPIMCKAHASFRGMLSGELPAKTLQSSICLSLHTLSLSHTQPSKLNPTINTQYKRLNKITIKFGTKLKPTKQIVVNYNFTISILFWIFCMVLNIFQNAILKLLSLVIFIFCRFQYP